MMNRLRNISIGIFIVYERVGSLVYNFLCRSRDKVFSLYTNTQVKNKRFRPHDIEDSIRVKVLLERYMESNSIYINKEVLN